MLYIINKVDILLLPYNYVLSPYIRKIVKLDVKNSIIVFDEAHNIENTAEKACSLELSFESLEFTKKHTENNKTI